MNDREIEVSVMSPGTVIRVMGMRLMVTCLTLSNETKQGESEITLKLRRLDETDNAN